MPPAEEMAGPSNAVETDKGCSMLVNNNESEQVMSSSLVLEKVKNRPRRKRNYKNWRNHAIGRRKINAYALRNKFLTDVTFIVGPEAKEIHAHRLILALGSPVFEAMFFGSLPETEGNVVTVPDITPEGFQCLLEYIYSESCSFQNENEAFEACVAAQKYCVPSLNTQCDKYICTIQLSPDKVWSYLDYSLLLDLKAFTENCLSFIQSHTKLSFQSSSFLEADCESVEHVLKLNCLDVHETELLRSLVRWAEAKAEGGKNAKELLIPLFRHIRFGSLKVKDFCNFLKESGRYLNDSDSLAILKHLVKPSKYSLPDWCCTKSWRLQVLHFRN